MTYDELEGLAPTLKGKLPPKECLSNLAQQSLTVCDVKSLDQVVTMAFLLGMERVMRVCCNAHAEVS